MAAAAAAVQNSVSAPKMKTAQRIVRLEKHYTQNKTKISRVRSSPPYFLGGKDKIAPEKNLAVAPIEPKIAEIERSLWRQRKTSRGGIPPPTAGPP